MNGRFVPDLFPFFSEPSVCIKFRLQESPKGNGNISYQSIFIKCRNTHNTEINYLHGSWMAVLPWFGSLYFWDQLYVKFRLKKVSIHIDQLWNKSHVIVFNHWIFEKPLWTQILGAICMYWDMSPRVVKGNNSYNSVHIKSNSKTDQKGRHKMCKHLFFVILEH